MPTSAKQKVRIVASAEADSLSNEKRTMLYRVAQEALTNIAKHSQADRVRVALRKVPKGIRLTVSDNGQAFDVRLSGSKAWRDRFGLIGMRERVEMVGGVFSITSVKGKGTIISAFVPFLDQMEPVE
jgi:signal transduction histidine kinase